VATSVQNERTLSPDGYHDPAEVLKVREALKMLYDILEDYAPSWYTEEHHDKAGTALGSLKV
jgi:hypothetical protein